MPSRKKQSKQEDAELVRKAKEDPEEYGFLYVKYARNVYSYLWRRVGQSREIAEDLMQDTFLRAFRGLSGFQSRGYSYLTYLLRIAHNVVIMHYRKGKKEVPLSELKRDIAERGEGVEETIDRAIDVVRLRRAMERIPQSQQDVLKAYYLEERPVREIASRLGKSENAVKLQLSRARKRLGVLLEDTSGPPVR